MSKVNLARLKGCMRRAAAGEELAIGFLGGSITQGSLATKKENTYAFRVYSWWEKTFPQARFHYVNGGIGGTTSHYGVSRAVRDVLMYRPDFAVVDFSVNDEADVFFQETYEGVVRKLLSWPSAPAVVLLNNVFYDTGLNAQEYHNAVGEWYQLPCVSIRDTVYVRMREGEYTRPELTSDGLHPNDKGHGLVAGEITSFLEKVKERMWEEEEEPGMPEPMTPNGYEEARCLTIHEISPRLYGFRADTEEKMGHLDLYKNGWIGKKAGDRIVFEVEAASIAVQYRKTIRRPAACAKLVLDGDRDHEVLLDGNFEEDWGDCLYLEPILHHGVWKIHTVEIEIAENEIAQNETAGNETEEVTPFYITALIVA